MLSFPTGSRRKVTDEERAKASAIIYQQGYLYGLRGNWMAHWTEIAQRVNPDHAFLFQNYAQLTMQGDKRNTEIFDTTALTALTKFADIMDSLLTPRDSVWHQIKADDPILQRNKSARLYYEQLNNILWKERYKPTANFAAQNQNIFRSLGAYGTGCLFTDALQDKWGGKGLRYLDVHLSEIYIQENHQRKVDKIFRRFMLTARQAVGFFGDTCPDQITTQVEKNPDSQFFFIHEVAPNTDWDPGRRDAKGMRYTSNYASVEGNCLVWNPNRPQEQGFHTFPYAVPRYRQAPNEAYGRSPMMDCLPAIKTLNEHKKAMMKQMHRAVDPVLLAHDDGIVDSFNTQPGNVNAGGVTSDGRELVKVLPIGQIQAGIEFQKSESEVINDSMLVALFQILIESPEMTATEVMERTKEKGILLTPTVGRQQSEYLGDVIPREIDVLARQGMLPPMPRIIQQAQEHYKIYYDSPISRVARAESASGAMHALQIFGNYASLTGDKGPLNVINFKTAGPEIAEIYGVPEHWINSPQQVAQLEEQQKSAAAMQATIQAGPAQAALMKAHVAAGGALPNTPMAAQQAQASGPQPPNSPQNLQRRKQRGPLGR